MVERYYNLKIKPNPKAHYKTLERWEFRINVIRKFFNLPISKITPSYYQEMFNELGKTRGRDELSRLNNLIKKAIRLAQQDDLKIKDFTLESSDLFSQKKAKDDDLKYLKKASDYQKIRDYLKSNLYYSYDVIEFYLYFLFELGMRPAELMAITWKDIDFEKKNLYTYRRFNMTDFQFTDPKKGKNHEVSSKLNSVRYVPLSDTHLEVLEKLYREQKKYNQKFGIKNIDNQIFQHYGYINGVPAHFQCNQRIKEILKELEIEPEIDHSLYVARHTRASNLIREGIQLDSIAKVLGHTVKELTETYAHLLKEDEDSNFDKIRNL